MTALTPPSRLSLALNLLGAGVVLWSLASTPQSRWAVIAAYVAVAGWIVGRACLPYADARWPARHRVIAAAHVASALVAMVLGGLASASTSGVGLVPVVLAVGDAISDPQRPLIRGVGLGCLGVVAVAVGAVLADTGVLAVLAMIGGIAIAGLVGMSRRQARVAETQSKLLREKEFAARDEARRVALARDLHDLLAHSLGGLVIQLDAAEALLEANKTDSAAQRVSAARALAAAGLSDARRAVAALRMPVADGPDVDAADLRGDIDDLLAVHRSLGGTVEPIVVDETPGVAAVYADVLRRTIQESLSNARKHAPGEPVALHIGWHDDRVTITVTNPIAPAACALSRSGGGYGLPGMRERLAALDNGSSLVVEADSTPSQFRVDATVMLTGRRA
ncbi:sensor histidine kinase [Gordonia asplenii]|uniref:sensor histidine kinase n=1 Tax=Gordonia asplenii TaxID=2725283 RepID=UPI001B7D54C5|nr:histidine kinase [Gordonia asplenii]